MFSLWLANPQMNNWQSPTGNAWTLPILGMPLQDFNGCCGAINISGFGLCSAKYVMGNKGINRNIVDALIDREIVCKRYNTTRTIFCALLVMKVPLLNSTSVLKADDINIFNTVFGIIKIYVQFCIAVTLQLYEVVAKLMLP